IARLSRYHFTRVFARTVGLSPYAYVIVCRIEMAIHLLRDPDLSLSDIASLTGFNSAAQLSAMFRRQTGISSGKYRDGQLGERHSPVAAVHCHITCDHLGA
ncbi:MAG: helix-turn-helix transcriptional regulator, partial [Rhizomicrobium sp.]|nr:helix-turn-helix transcriptional regulator [Rhizomicrobium sp.]